MTTADMSGLVRGLLDCSRVVSLTPTPNVDLLDISTNLRNRHKPGQVRVDVSIHLSVLDHEAGRELLPGVYDLIDRAIAESNR